MKKQIIELLNEFAGSIGHGEEVITESQFEAIAEKLVNRFDALVMQAVSSGVENGGHLSNSQVEKFIGVCFDCESFDDTGCDEYTGCCVEPKSERGGKIIFGDTKKCEYYRES